MDQQQQLLPVVMSSLPVLAEQPRSSSLYIPVVEERQAQRFNNLGDLESTLRAVPVLETETMPMVTMRLDAGSGRLHTPNGSFALTTGALKDIVKQVGLGNQAATTLQKNGLAHCVEYTVNEYFRSQPEKKRRKVIYHKTMMGDIMVTLPSKRYVLTPHLSVLERVIESLPENLAFSSAILDAERMKLNFLDPDSNIMAENGRRPHIYDTSGMREGEIINGGLSIVTGYNYQALTALIELLRLACLNGMTVLDRAWKSRTLHMCPRNNSCILENDFRHKLESMMPVLEYIGNNLRNMARMPITSKLLHNVQRLLAEVPKYTRQHAGELLAPFARTAKIEWDYEGDLPEPRKMGDLRSADTRFDLLNLVTQLGRDANSFDQAHQLSQVGGWIILNY